MPWKECDRMSLKQEFIGLMREGHGNLALLCRRFNISRKTGYKWLRRFESSGDAGLVEQSRSPQFSPFRTPPEVEQLILAVRQKHPWGGRKIRSYLCLKGFSSLPSPSTITAILRRHDAITEQAAENAKPWQRFERSSPNELWQMDFKGPFRTQQGTCHPLTLLDDHSRFCVGLYACQNERRQTVKERLQMVFRRYGLPWQMNLDNGPPWGSAPLGRHTRLTLWLIRLGVVVSFSAPRHPQTNGKDERFHRTLKAEVIQQSAYGDNDAVQKAFDEWRTVYNFERPHEALSDNVPSTRYQVSHRSYPETLPEIVYGSEDEIRRVDITGRLSYQGREIRVSKALVGENVAIRPTNQDGVYGIYYVRQKMKTVNLNLIPKTGCV